MQNNALRVNHGNEKVEKNMSVYVYFRQSETKCM